MAALILVAALQALIPGHAYADSQVATSEVYLSERSATHAVALSGPVIQVQPLSLDFGIVNAGESSNPQQVVISNLGDADLHYSFSSNDPVFLVPSGSFTLGPGGTAPADITFQPPDGVLHNAIITVASDASNSSSIPITVSGQGNKAPTLDPIGDKSTSAFTELAFTVTGTDADDTLDDLLSFTMTSLPSGAVFDGTNGAFSWTPAIEDAGSYPVTFCVTDGRLSDCEGITITVLVTNNPPVANAGGNYSGATGQPVQFNGSATDPDAAFQTLTATWMFGDGFSGAGFTPTHTYGAPGNYLANLTVCDDGTPQLCDSDVAPVMVVNQITAQIITKTSFIKASGGGRETIGIEENAEPLTSIDVASIRMSSSATGTATIACQTKGATIGDMDNDGLPDLNVIFDRKDIDAFLASVPNNTVVTITITADVHVGVPILPLIGNKVVTIKKNGGGNQAVSVAAYPNPFNPETALSLTTRSSGPLTLKIYSIDGRLVRTLKDGEYTSAGTYEFRWNGIDNSGNHVSSGVYFVRASVGGGETSVFKLAVTR